MTCKYIQFLDVLDISPLNYDQNTLGIVSVKGGVARNLGLFT